ASRWVAVVAVLTSLIASSPVSRRCKANKRFGRGFRYRAGGSAGTLRAVPFDCLRVGRVGAHINAALPAALQRVDDIERHPPDALDLDLHSLAVLQCTEPLVIGAARD